MGQIDYSFNHRQFHDSSETQALEHPPSECPSCASTKLRFVGPSSFVSWSECQEVADLCKLSGGLYRCNVCDLVFRWPRPDSLALDHAYRSIPVTSWVHEEPSHWRKIANLIRMHAPNSSVLDIGCFRGDFLVSLGKRYDLHGIEPNVAAAQVAAARGIKMIGRELDANLNPYDGKFGAVILMDVLEHVPDPLAALAKVRRLLAPGGLVVILTGDSCYWVSRLSLPFYWYMGFPIHLVYLGQRFIQCAAAKQSYKIIYRSRIPHDPASPRRTWRARLRAVAVITARRCKNGSLTRWINLLQPFARLAKAKEPPRFPELPDHMLVLLRRKG
jgi:SAM-dependent methyltransferase